MKRITDVEIQKREESGFITLDFIFAFLLSVSFSVVLFNICITLSLVEVSQYITFAVSRTYNAAHENPDMQSELAKNKFKELMTYGAFKNVYSMDWVKLSEPQLGDFKDVYPRQSEEDADIFVGARIAMDARLMHMNIPFLGPTSDDPSVGKATLNSYLLREVSTEECREVFNRERWNNLTKIGPYSEAKSKNGAALITDNGC